MLEQQMDMMSDGGMSIGSLHGAGIPLPARCVRPSKGACARARARARACEGGIEGRRGGGELARGLLD